MNENENQVTINETTEDPTSKAIAEAVAKGIKEANKKKKGEEKPRLTIDKLKAELATRGITIRYNTIKNDMEITPSTGDDMDYLVTQLYSDIGGKYTYSTMSTIGAYATSIGKDNRYNPFMDYLQSLSWDGVDRLPELYTLFNLSEDDTLSRTMLHKWLLQTVCLQYNSPQYPFGADGALAFVGPQGSGKTEASKKLAGKDEFFLESGEIRDNDKDYERRLLGVVVAELGEVDSTFKKSDVARIKAFITRGIDAYRLPYGRQDIKSPRHTSLIATVNDSDFLVDTTGNRRFWTIPFTRIKYADLDAFDMGKIWAQIYATVQPMTIKEKAGCFRLTPEERAALDERNSKHEVPMKGQTEVAEILEDFSAEKGYMQSWMYVKDFRKTFIDDLGRYDTKILGKILTRLGVPSKPGKKKTALYLVPTGTKEEVPKEWQKD